MKLSESAQIDVEILLKDLKTNTIEGLKKKQILENLKQYGSNNFSSIKVTWISIFLRQFKSPFIYLLIGAAILSLLLRDEIDSYMIILFILIDVFLGFYQEYKSEKTVKLLKSYIVQNVLVNRDSKEQFIKSTELVVGDIIILKAGDIVPADIRIISSTGLTLDESILTGESLAVEKSENPLKSTSSKIYNIKNILFKGTSLASGECKGVVIAVGKDTEFGKIVELSNSSVKDSVFQNETQKISTYVLKLVSITLIFVFLLNILIKGETTNYIELLIFSVALAVSAIPEALPVVSIFSLSRGAAKLAKNKVVVKRLSAIEALGNINMLCTDKTGTLTENKLVLYDIYSKDKPKTIFYSLLTSVNRLKSIKKNTKDSSFDLATFEKLDTKEKKILLNINVLDEIPFDPNRKISSALVLNNKNKELVLRGAPEAVLNVCNISKSDYDQAFTWYKDMGTSGKRVVAVCYKSWDKDTYDNDNEKDNFIFLGMLSFEDALKNTAINAIKKAENLGVSIKVLTGDSIEVAGSVANKIGLIDDPKRVVLGDSLDRVVGKELEDLIFSNIVFARLTPQHKHTIISILKKKYTVGFMGDGINDSPGLKIADVAIAVNDASDIARDSADIILLRKSLDVIVSGIKEGREIFVNTSKYIKITLASNFGNFFAVAISTLFINYLPMLPIQILLLNLLSDFPMISISTDNVSNDELRLPSVFSLKELTSFSLAFGALSTVFDFIFLGIFIFMGAQVLQTSWFVASVITEIVFLFTARVRLPILKAQEPSKLISILGVIVIGTTLVLPYISIGHILFSFVSIPLKNILLIIGIILGYLISNEILKHFYYKNRFTASN